jgi:hypothetical protein
MPVTNKRTVAASFGISVGVGFLFGLSRGTRIGLMVRFALDGLQSVEADIHDNRSRMHLAFSAW